MVRGLSDPNMQGTVALTYPAEHYQPLEKSIIKYIDPPFSLIGWTISFRSEMRGMEIWSRGDGEFGLRYGLLKFSTLV